MPSLLDMQTIFFLSGIVNFTLCLSMLMVYRMKSTYPGFLEWTLSSTCLFGSLTLLAVHGMLPDVARITLANLLVVSFPLLLLRGLRRFAGLKPQDWFVPAILIPVFLISVYFSSVRSSPNARVLALSLIFALVFAECARVVYREKAFVYPGVRWWLIGSFSVATGWVLARVPMNLALEHSATGLYSPTLSLSITLAMLTAVNVAIVAGMIMLNFERASDSLRDSEERFRILAEAAFEGIVVSESGRVLDMNRRALAYFGFELPEVIGKRIVDFVVPESREQVAEAIRTNSEKTYKHRVIRKDGSTFPVETQAKTLHRGGRILRLTAVRDITEDKNVEQKLSLARDQALEAARVKSEFLATMSHEIRTPMNAIVGMSDLLSGTPLSEDQAEMVKSLQNGTAGLMAIINDILDFSRIEAGKLRVVADHFELREVIADAVNVLAPKAREKKLGLSCQVDPALGPVLYGDSRRIRQVLGNLVGNAIKFTDRGEVSVNVRPVANRGPDQAFRVAVRDTGIGIPAEAQNRLFQPFSQVDGSSTRRFGGTGLGLAISQQLVELMGGRIGFESDPGQGSTFWFELELPRSPTHAMLDSRAPHPANVTTRLRLLLVEDDLSSQMVAQLLLAKLGHTVEVVGNGREALDRLAQQPYNGVLMDCQVPVLDGYATTRLIREGVVAGLNPRIPIIALTAYALPEDEQRCLAAGMDAYVTKPLRADALRAALAKCGLGTKTPDDGAPQATAAEPGR